MRSHHSQAMRQPRGSLSELQFAQPWQGDPLSADARFKQRRGKAEET